MKTKSYRLWLSILVFIAVEVKANPVFIPLEMLRYRSYGWEEKETFFGLSKWPQQIGTRYSLLGYRGNRYVLSLAYSDFDDLYRSIQPTLRLAIPILGSLTLWPTLDYFSQTIESQRTGQSIGLGMAISLRLSLWTLLYDPRLDLSMKSLAHSLQGKLEIYRWEIGFRVMAIDGQTDLRFSFGYQFDRAGSVLVSYSVQNQSLGLEFRFELLGSSISIERQVENESGRWIVGIQYQASKPKREKNHKKNHKKKRIKKPKKPYNPYRFLTFSLLIRWGISPLSALKLVKAKQDPKAFETVLTSLPARDSLLLGQNLKRIYRKKR